MNGRIIPDTPIVVDLWRRVINPSSKLYFLSHMHSDHTQGLSASWRWPIYCSPITAKLLVEKFQIGADHIRPLELNTNHFVKVDHSGKETMTVTLFDANHCPGSVMFLFEGYFGRVFYTGDFRYDPATFPTSFLGPKQPVDRLYLDNTFNNPRCKFPSRSYCKKRILEILREHPEHEIVLAIYTLGKEDLLVDIALALQTRIVVSQSRMNMLQLLELPDVFTTNQNEGRVRLVRRQAISRKNMTKWNDEAPTIAIIPTGLFTTLDGQPYANQDDVFIVPYSDHSSYPELQEFVSIVCPRAIHPIVSDSQFMSSNRSVADMHNFDRFLNRSPGMPFVIPPSVRQYMSTDFSNPSSFFGSRNKFMKLKRIQSSNRRSNPRAVGVVFDDNRNVDEETEGEEKQERATRSPNSPNKTQCKVDKQEQQLDENENHGIIKLSPQSVVETTKSVNKQEEDVLKQCSQESCLAAGNTDTRWLREERWVEPKINKMLSQSSREPTTNLFPNKMITNLASGKKDLFNKTRKRTSMEGEHPPGQGQDDVLIQTMSSKRSRTLPPSFVVAPTTETKQSSRVKLYPPKLSSSSTITDFFQRVNPQTKTMEKSDRVLVESKQVACNRNAPVASLPDERSYRTNKQNLISTVHKPNHGCVSTKSTFNESKPDEHFMSFCYKRYSDKTKLKTPVSTVNEKEALESLTAARETKHKSSPCPLTSSRCSLKSHPSETPFNHVNVIKRKRVSEYPKRNKLTEALDKFILNHM